ncbi:phosphotransferase [Protofrankia symbiont of Coriaria ruscifolia]|uniref:Aminoglycoside phosphotransferase n=1 Tax=Candidatus Protofrankia californiensis TaxID=1839754 RepID=A0A1C3NU21_9ACTN|nr:phosphotransferase [Protofrankia symbiont of Coriaria ruscifolia]SBW18438.1 aminoglycoside phosphotransferase [Candidatus Protofrankia californiensis]
MAEARGEGDPPVADRSLSRTGKRRILWQELPPEVRRGIESCVGASVIGAVSQPGGFSEGLASLLALADGRRVFVKAASRVGASAVAEFHLREIAITARLPAVAPVPRLVDSYDDGVWVAGIYAEIQGRLPSRPWRHGELSRVLDALTALSTDLTPAPVDPALLAAPRLGGWRALAQSAGGGALACLAAITPWAADRIDDLVTLEADADRDLAGRTLLHGDLYGFNILLGVDGVSAVDWPHAWIGAPFCDVVTLLSSASIDGVDPEQYARDHPLIKDVDPRHVDVLLAAHSGFLLRLVTTADPSADPSLIAMASALGVASLRWLQERGLGSRARR